MNEKEEALSIIRECGLFPKNRLTKGTKGEKLSCQTETELVVYNDYINYGEESELIPSQTIYLKGCNLQCEFCQAASYLENPNSGNVVSPDEMVSSILDGLEKGAKNVNFLGGEPTVFLFPLLEVMRKISGKQKVVWNSNMYFDKKILVILRDLVNLYLADLKFGNDDCAKRLSGADNYSNIVRENILSAIKHADVIIRHLVIPGHIECCTIPVLKWIEKKLPNVKVSLMANYTPNYASKMKELNRFLTDDELLYINELKEQYRLNYIS